MGKLNQRLQNLPANVEAIVRGNHNHDQLNDVISLSHAFAIVLLKKKIATGKLNLNIFRLDIHDIAYDCIAELFRMDGEQPLVQLKSYFSGIDLQCASAQEVANHLRRLTFSKVNQGLFRLYAEYDSSLGKILRNIKIAVQSLNNFIEVDRFGETYLVPSVIKEDFSHPLADHDLLIRWLREALKGNERIPEVLSKLSLHLQRQHEWAKAVSFIGLGIALRSLFAEEFTVPVQQPELPQKEDAVIVIRNVCQNVQKKMNESYVGKKKLTRAEYGIMFNVIQQHLMAIVIEGDGKGTSLFERMKKETAGLTKQTYMKKHKPIVEYLLALTKQELGRELKKEL